jgi:glucose/arabinose dehydrogenase
MGIRPKLAVATGAAAAAAMLALAACGSAAQSPAAQPPSASAPPGASPGASAQPAAATIASMKLAVQAAASVHLNGTLSGTGTGTGTGAKTVGLDVSLTRSSGFSGTVTQNGIPLTIIDAGGTVYIRATKAFLAELNVPAAVCSVMCGKYVAMSRAKGDALAGQLDMSQMLQSVTGRLPAFTKAGTQTVNGQRAQVLTGADGSTLAVAATGTPYPLEAISPHGGRDRIAFSQWNSVPTPAAPPASQVIDLSKLGG